MDFPKVYPRVETERLILRGFEKSDASDAQRLAGDRAIADTTAQIPHPYEDGMAEQWISSHAEDFSNGVAVHFAIELAVTNELIGAISLMNIDALHSRAELGYWVGKSYWNNGFCTEATRAVVQHAFDVLRLNRVYAQHLTRNPASGAVLVKAGMRREGLLRQHLCKWGVFEDVEVYAILNPNKPQGITA
ncbi:MAG: GNAT family N-acetyltransferase [bacterium]|nr:GNAT family N-acetyltransferase [bacterium]